MNNDYSDNAAITHLNNGITAQDDRLAVLAKYHDAAKKSCVDSTLVEFNRVNEVRYDTYMRNDIRLYTYMKRLIDIILPHTDDIQIAFALFNGDGCLLKILGKDKALNDMQLSPAMEGTIWSMDEIGPNAVTIGLAENLTLYSSGKENYNDKLKKYAIYFSPVTLHAYFDSPMENHGGIAVIKPVKLHYPEQLTLAATISNDLTMNLHASKLTNKLYAHYNEGLMMFDTAMQNGRVIITYCNQQIFDIFQTYSRELYLTPADSFIAPLPENREFWSIIRQHKAVNNLSITLYVQDRPYSCLITTDFLVQPSLKIERVIIYITTPQRISSQVSKKMGNSAIFSFGNIIGNSPAVLSAVKKGRLLAKMSSNSILLQGESGVGKDLFAQAIHNSSYRSEKPFIAVNCGALPRDLITSELFGYESGAFTGAKRNGNIGKFELANSGTIFLDEINALPLDLQATLLRVVEQKQLTRLGSAKLVDLDVRIISATNEDLMTMINQKKFRSDLYYRLGSMTIYIPPLRERGEDVILLAEYFVNVVSKRIGRTDIMELSEEAKELLQQLQWPGNVRELQNLIEIIVQLYPEHVINPAHIIDNINSLNTTRQINPPVTKRERRHLLTQDDILDALEKCGGNRSEAAQYLGVARKTLYRYMDRLDIGY